ncbi:MAG: hypothetical protein R3C11_23730 [Planctomycetaceae bacterium]
MSKSFSKISWLLLITSVGFFSGLSEDVLNAEDASEPSPVQDDFLKEQTSQLITELVKSQNKLRSGIYFVEGYYRQEDAQKDRLAEGEMIASAYFDLRNGKTRFQQRRPNGMTSLERSDPETPPFYFSSRFTNTQGLHGVSGTVEPRLNTAHLVPPRPDQPPYEKMFDPRALSFANQHHQLFSETKFKDEIKRFHLITPSQITTSPEGYIIITYDKESIAIASLQGGKEERRKVPYFREIVLDPNQGYNILSRTEKFYFFIPQSSVPYYLSSEYSQEIRWSRREEVFVPQRIIVSGKKYLGNSKLDDAIDYDVEFDWISVNLSFPEAKLKHKDYINFDFSAEEIRHSLKEQGFPYLSESGQFMQNQ